jgi:hypothetical protein
MPLTPVCTFVDLCGIRAQSLSSPFSYTLYRQNFSSFQVGQMGDTKCRLSFIITKMFKVDHEENFAAAKSIEPCY